ncbi:MAG: baseplate J/gp47 family protein [Candidatus Kerfeldbacteria bacterium]|nr:baseplate J/gp47 family protein [Candidatus Kerfeldbacteria bacterium]
MTKKHYFQGVKTGASYRRLLMGFTAAVAIILGLIVYFSFSKTEIRVTLNPVPETNTLSVNVAPADQVPTFSSPAVPGSVISREYEKSASIVLEGEGTEQPAQATGTVTIYNNWSDTQVLAATTRLLTPDGVLFRIKERVDIPAGESVENVAVYADQAGPQGNIKPTRFIIPGLWEGLQDDIYAESTETMTGGLRTVRILTQQDVANARDDVLNDIKNDAIAELGGDSAAVGTGMTISPDAIDVTALETLSTPEAGEEASTFTVTVSARVVIVAYDQTRLTELLQTNFESELTAEVRVAPDAAPEITMSVKSYDLEKKVANLTASFSQHVIPRLDNPIFDREKLINKDEQEIREYFSHFDEVQSVSVRFSPFWVRQSPGLTDHIAVTIEE